MRGWTLTSRRGQVKERYSPFIAVEHERLKQRANKLLFSSNAYLLLFLPLPPTPFEL